MRRDSFHRRAGPAGRRPRRALGLRPLGLRPRPHGAQRRHARSGQPGRVVQPGQHGSAGARQQRRHLGRDRGAVRQLAVQEGEVYVVSGPAFVGSNLQSLKGRVLVPTHLWKVVYSPQRQQAGVYLVTNDETKTYSALTVSELEQLVGIEALPGVPQRVRDSGMDLPVPHSQHVAGKKDPQPVAGTRDRRVQPGRPGAPLARETPAQPRQVKDHPMSDFKPYANESDVLTVGNLSIENRLDRLTLHGDVELTKDKKGLGAGEAAAGRPRCDGQGARGREGVARGGAGREAADGEEPVRLNCGVEPCSAAPGASGNLILSQQSVRLSSFRQKSAGYFITPLPTTYVISLQFKFDWANFNAYLRAFLTRKPNPTNSVQQEIISRRLERKAGMVAV